MKKNMTAIVNAICLTMLTLCLIDKLLGYKILPIGNWLLIDGIIILAMIDRYIPKNMKKNLLKGGK